MWIRWQANCTDAVNTCYVCVWLWAFLWVVSAELFTSPQTKSRYYAWRLMKQQHGMDMTLQCYQYYYQKARRLRWLTYLAEVTQSTRPKHTALPEAWAGRWKKLRSFNCFGWQRVRWAQKIFIQDINWQCCSLRQQFKKKNNNPKNRQLMERNHLVCDLNHLQVTDSHKDSSLITT